MQQLFPSPTIPHTLSHKLNHSQQNFTIREWSPVIQIWKKKPLVRTQTSLTISQDSKEKKMGGPGKVNAFVFI